MIALAYYLLKVIVCSGLLFLYYHITLRNKLFHQWNRFYLLATIILSLTIPCLEFNIWPAEKENKAATIQLLQVVYSADEYVAEINSSKTQLSAEQWAVITYSAFSALVLVLFLLALLRIRSIIRSHSVLLIDDIKFINTEEKDSPFSFFNYIFWNKQIELNSPSGEHIFQHELVHIREKHSLDKIFLQLILIPFWCNPFFWMMRRELRMIHEFIADKRSVGQSDAHAFATMILHTVYPQHYTHLTNQFFHHSIKRRLAMLTKNRNTRISYVSRILALPLMAFLVLAFTVKEKNRTTKNNLEILKSSIISDTVTLHQPTAIRQFRDKSIQWIYNDSVGEKISWEAAKKGFIINEKEFRKKFNQKDYVDVPLTLIKRNKKDTLTPNPLIVIDGKEYGKKNAGNIDQLISADKIKSMNVLKGETAKAKYGEKGSDSVIEIITKQGATYDASIGDVARQNFYAAPPLVIIDGKVSDKIKELSPDGIASITVLKGITGIKKYGEKAKGGVIEITTKPSNNYSINKETIEEITLDGVKIRPGERVIEGKKDNKIEIRDTVPNKIFQKVEQEAEFPGGKEGWKRFLQKQLNPTVPSDNGAPVGSYTVELQFIVNLDGSLSDIKALTKHGYGMEEECLQLLSKGPKWIPARQNGHKVVSYRKQNITFVIADG